MSTPLENAIEELQETVNAFGQGTSSQPKDGSTPWYLLRAHTTGLAYLKRLQQLGIESDPGACERVYRKGSAMFKSAEVPPTPVIVKETLPGKAP